MIANKLNEVGTKIKDFGIVVITVGGLLVSIGYIINYFKHEQK